MDLALHRAGNTGIKEDAIIWLNQILFDTYTGFDWPFLWKMANIVFSGINFPLPERFIKLQDLRPLRLVDANGNSSFPVEVDRATIEVAIQDRNVTGIPAIFCIDWATPIGMVYPNPQGYVVNGQMRYKELPDDLVVDEQIPTFPWHNFLIQALYCMILEYDKDERAMMERANRDQMMMNIRKVALPGKAISPVIELDPEVFSRPNYES